MITLHIYGQGSQHEDVVIAGSIGELAILASKLHTAIDHKDKAEMFSTPNDGEGYNVLIKVLNDEDCNKLPVPYYKEVAKETNQSRVAYFESLVKEFTLKDKKWTLN